MTLNYIISIYDCYLQYSVRCSGPDTKAAGHSGILEAAKAVLEDLQSTGTLQALMQDPPVNSFY